MKTFCNFIGSTAAAFRDSELRERVMHIDGEGGKKGAANKDTI